MRRDRFFGTLVALALGAFPLQAEVVPGKWQKVQAQPVGKVLNVELNSGERLTGNLTQADASELVLKTENGERRMDAAEVKTISLPGVKDSSLDGAAWGAFFGALGGIGLGSAMSRDFDSKAGAMAGGVIPGTGIGFGLGYFFDKTKGGEEIIYRVK